VTHYNPIGDTHDVAYDDGDRKTYKMSEKTWELIERSSSTSSSGGGPLGGSGSGKN